MIISNKIRCNNCGEVIESMHVHDYVPCMCGEVAVDGGRAYLKRSGNNYTEMSLSDKSPYDQVRKAYFIVVSNEGLTRKSLSDLTDTELESVGKFGKIHHLLLKEKQYRASSRTSELLDKYYEL